MKEPNLTEKKERRLFLKENNGDRATQEENTECGVQGRGSGKEQHGPGRGTVEPENAAARSCKPRRGS